MNAEKNKKIISHGDCKQENEEESNFEVQIVERSRNYYQGDQVVPIISGAR